MAMLAEPRRFRKRYNLAPRGKALFEDDNRFGTKMLERMGWTKGKGLGAREDGSQDFVRIRYKNDANGVGYEDRDDQWTEHEKQFNGLLTSLNNSEANSDVEEEENTGRIGFGFALTEKNKDKLKVKSKISGESLEEKSKKSKSRVHYKKFTKGKDLSQYSEKDLANIFGKKIDDTTTFQKFEPIVIDVTEKDSNCEENRDVSKKFGITIISKGTSVTDYFKQKMEEMKRNRSIGVSKNVSDVTENLDHQDTVAEEQKNAIPEVLENTETIGTTETYKKKKRKNVEIVELPVENLEVHKGETVEDVNISVLKNLLDTTENHQDKIEEEQKKKRKKKNTIPEAVENAELIGSTEICKKKKRKNTEISELPVANLEEHEVKTLEDVIIIKPRNQKRKLDTTVNNEELQVADFEDISVEKRKEKTRNSKQFGNSEDLPAENFKNNSTERSKKKKVKPEIAVIKDEVGNSTEMVEKKKKTSINSELMNSDKRNKKKDKLPSPELSTHLDIIEERKCEKLTTTTEADVPENDVSEPPNNTVYINEYCAEKFRHTDLNHFPGSNLLDIIGYGLQKDIKLEIVKHRFDEQNITNLWCKNSDISITDKYNLYHCPFRKHQKKLYEARKNKTKMPKINMKRFKNRSVFKNI